MNLIEYIRQQMNDDDDNLERQSERLAHLYASAGAPERAAIDDALICVCGYSMPSILESAGAEPADTDPMSENLIALGGLAAASLASAAISAAAAADRETLADAVPAGFAHVSGTYGEFLIDAEGWPRGELPAEYADIKRFAVDEWRRHYGRAVLNTYLDVCDLAHFSVANGYQPAPRQSESKP